MLLLGHRGCRGPFTENTFAAFDYALQSGCDGFELDVRRTADCAPIIWHDARLGGRFISRHLYSNLLSHCSLARRVPPRPAIDLCQLEQVLSRYALVSFIDIELKVPGLATQVAQLLRHHRPARGVIVSSFRPRILLEVHRADPSLPLALIFDRMPAAKLLRELPIQYVKPSARLVTPARVRQFHAAGKSVLTWTVNDPALMHRLAKAGVDGMIGDDPATLVGTLGPLRIATRSGR